MTSKIIDITPDTSLLPKLGRSGYKVSQALAEFIDNSLDARVNDKVTVNIDLRKDEIKVRDDGRGMSEEEATKALKLAYVAENKKSKLGEFGLGLKTAATSLGKQFQITTSSASDNNIYRLLYNEDEWLKANSWSSQKLDYLPKQDETKHWTEIIITEFKIKFYPNLVTNVKKYLSKQFAQYIESGQLVLIFNGEPLAPQMRELVDNKKYPFEIEAAGNLIKGWYGFLKVRHVGGEYGFNLFKNGRLITSDAKIGFEPHPEIAVIVGDIDLSFVPASHNKKEFITESSEFFEAWEALKEFFKNEKLLPKAREIASKSQVNKIEDQLSDKIKKITDEVKLVENYTPLTTDQFENDNTSYEISDPQTIEKIELLKSKDELEENQLSIYNVNGIDYKFQFSLLNLGPENKWVQYLKREGSDYLDILINIDFPFYRACVKEYKSYTFILLAEAIAEYIVKENNLSTEKIILLRDGILRQIGETQLKVEEKRKGESKRKKLEKELEELDEQLNKSKSNRN
jgi:hypothetical protein